MSGKTRQSFSLPLPGKFRDCYSIIDAINSGAPGHIIQAFLADSDCANDRDQENFTPLYAACGHGREDIVKLLLEAGADPNSENHDHGANPLHIASNWGNVETVRLLLEHGAKVEGTGTYLYTPLHGACKYGEVEIVRLLLDHGANGTKEDIKGNTPLYYTELIQIKEEDIHSRREAIVEIFREYCPEAILTEFCKGSMSL